jgi:hypothetical protein
MSSFTCCREVVEAFIEIAEPINEWREDKTSGGLTVWAGTDGVNLRWPAGHIELAKSLEPCGGYGRPDRSPHWHAVEPLEIMTWVAMATKYIV